MQTNPVDHFHLNGITVRTLRISTMHFNWRQGEIKSLVCADVIEVFYFGFLFFPTHYTIFGIIAICVVFRMSHACHL